MKLLWDNPKFVSIILLNSSESDVKNNLANFFTNNFFENILSSNCIENNLLYLITLLLKHEINNILDIEKPEMFLNSTKCGYILNQLYEKIEIQIFFRTVISEIIEKFSKLDSGQNEELSFNPKELKEIYIRSKKKNLNEKRIEIDNEKNNEFKLENAKTQPSVNDEEENKKEAQIKMIFKNKYMKPLKELDLKQFSSKYENKTNKSNMKDFINNIINLNKLFPNLFITKTICENFKYGNNNEDNYLLNLYEYNYIQVSKYIDIIFNNLLKNINLIPYSVKCICKIILKLLEKKYSKICNYQKNALISKFFFHTLFIPMLVNYEYFSLVNEFNLTSKQKNSLIIFSEIIKKFTLCKLFKDDKNEGNYTPFNWMIIEKMPLLLDFYEKMTNVKLPDFIEKLIDNKLSKDYKYNYFEENKNDDIIHISFCFSIENIYILIKNIEKNKGEIFKENLSKELQKTIEKLLNEDNMKKLEKLKNNKEYQLYEETTYESCENFLNSENENENHINGIKQYSYNPYKLMIILKICWKIISE